VAKYSLHYLYGYTHTDKGLGMGMFDWISCKKSLPVIGMSDEPFQTKSLDSLMQDYLIDADGILWVGRHSVLGSTFGANVDPYEPQYRRPSSFTGTINFYGNSGEFNALFLSGQLMGEILYTQGTNYKSPASDAINIFVTSTNFSRRFTAGSPYLLVSFAYNNFSERLVILKDIMTGENLIITPEHFALNFKSVAVQMLLKERTALLDTKFRCGLNAEETLKLEYLRWMLDCLDVIQRSPATES
jgi:hypothetical protein